MGSHVFDGSAATAIERFQESEETGAGGKGWQVGGVDVAEVGTVLSVGDGIARVYGLDKVMAGELVDFGHDIFGLALNLEQDQVGVVLLGEAQQVKEGQEVRRTRRIIQVPVGPALVGRVVDALGRPIDGKGPIQTTEFYPTSASRRASSTARASRSPCRRA